MRLRSRLKCALAVAGLLALAAPAHATSLVPLAGTTNAQLVAPTFNAGTSIPLVTLVDAPIGTLLVIPIINGVTGSATFNCTDPLGTTYLTAVTGTQNGANQKTFYARLTTDMPAGTTLTCTSSLSAPLATVLAFSNSDPTAPLDVVAQAAGAATNATAGPTAALACPDSQTACGVAVGSYIRHASTTVTNDATYVNLGSGNQVWALGYKFVNSNAAVSYAITTGGSANYSITVATFKASPAASGSAPPQSLIGVGP